MQEELYAKICSLSYMGDLRMLFAEDRNKVKLNQWLHKSTNLHSVGGSCNYMAKHNLFSLITLSTAGEENSTRAI